MSKKPTAKGKGEAAPAVTPAPKPASEQVLVIVGGRGAAGRIMRGEVIYDGFTPRLMTRESFDRLQATYDLREVKPQ